MYAKTTGKKERETREKERPATSHKIIKRNREREKE